MGSLWAGGNEFRGMVKAQVRIAQTREISRGPDTRHINETISSSVFVTLKTTNVNSIAFDFIGNRKTMPHETLHRYNILDTKNKKMFTVGSH